MQVGWGVDELRLYVINPVDFLRGQSDSSLGLIRAVFAVPDVVFEAKSLGSSRIADVDGIDHLLAVEDDDVV